SFSWSLFIPMAFIYLVTSLEAIGDITATSKLSNQPVDGPKWMQRIKGGVLVNGANSFLAGIFNTFPSSVFAQNNGVIQLRGVARGIDGHLSCRSSLRHYYSVCRTLRPPFPADHCYITGTAFWCCTSSTNS